MVGALPVAGDVIAVVDELIKQLGPEAFITNGRVQLYSGPRSLIRRALLHLADNHGRAFGQAARLNAAMIDGTKIGQLLGKYEDDKDIYAYFEQHYSSVYGPNSREAFEEADKVMRHTSRAFMKAAFGHVATAVCGADTGKIFFSEELPELVENDKIETVNGIPAQLIKDFYKIDPYEAFRLICLAELWEARRYAKDVNTLEAWADYRERFQFFSRERQDTMKTLSTMLPDEMLHLKLSKQRVLANYKLMEHMAAIIDADPVPPPAAIIASRGAHGRLRHGLSAGP